MYVFILLEGAAIGVVSLSLVLSLCLSCFFQLPFFSCFLENRACSCPLGGQMSAAEISQNFNQLPLDLRQLFELRRKK